MVYMINNIFHSFNNKQIFCLHILLLYIEYMYRYAKYIKFLLSNLIHIQYTKLFEEKKNDIDI